MDRFALTTPTVVAIEAAEVEDVVCHLRRHGFSYGNVVLAHVARHALERHKHIVRDHAHPY